LEYLEYGSAELTYLKSRDPKLGAVIDRVGFIKREVTPDLFTALVFSIVGQQISPKAADTVSNRLTGLLGIITPDAIRTVPVEELRACGLSGRKAGYMKGIAELITGGSLDLESFGGLSDGEIINRLSALPGIGVWTAEMMLIFSLRRPDVVSYGDLAIRRGMMRVYELEALSKEQFMKYRQRYTPYGTVASLYLWAASKGE
jgi:3-methyladenine DNA glycosylase/8-oxoguanine DNA glycosylase